VGAVEATLLINFKTVDDSCSRSTSCKQQCMQQQKLRQGQQMCASLGCAGSDTAGERRTNGVIAAVCALTSSKLQQVVLLQ
jgi:hypothetical protein